MSAGWRRIFLDLKQRRHVDVYVVASAAIVFAVLSLFGDVLPDNVRWAVLLAGVSLLVFRMTLTESPRVADDLLNDRTTFDDRPLSRWVSQTSEIWIFAPSAANFLSARHCELLRDSVLNRRDGIVRVVVLDPREDAAVRIATRQLDDSLDYPLQEFGACLTTTLGLLQKMASWSVSGSFEYRLLGYNPGFSLVVIDPGKRKGRVIVEFHGFHNQMTSARMHIELTHQLSEYWYGYWTDQFRRIWDTAKSAPGS
jgi:hypothetical protein